jgi:hypothetical protein
MLRGFASLKGTGLMVHTLRSTSVPLVLLLALPLAILYDAIV